MRIQLSDRPALSRLVDGEIDLWLVDLDRDASDIESLFELLSPDEKERAGKFVYANDRSRFIVCRATLRQILGGYLGIAPKKVGLSVRHYGKPYLSGGDLDLRFNVSHSRGNAVIAVTLNREVGVDIEFVDHNFEVFSVAPSHFPEAEVSRLRMLPRSLRVARFFVGWTRKEALLKAFGDGLSSSDELQSAVADIGCSDDSFHTFADDRSTEWSVRTFQLNDDFKGALAVEGPIEALRFWRHVA